MTKDRFSKWPLSKSPKSPRNMLQVPQRTVSKLCCSLLRTVTFCYVLLGSPGFTTACFSYHIRTVTAVANFLTTGFKIWHGNLGLPSLSIPPPCVAPRPSRFLQGGLKRGENGMDVGHCAVQRDGQTWEAVTAVPDFKTVKNLPRKSRYG